jgi:hypothetical protein
MALTKTAPVVEVKVADEVWIVTALLHRDHAGEIDFSIDEIMKRAEVEKLTGELRPGVYAHVVQHCVANRPPNSGRYRMLIETAPGRRRLFRPGDSYHAQREHSKALPETEDLPGKYRSLIAWYTEWNQNTLKERINNDPLLALYGSGQDLWADEPADEYVRRLREGWE